MSIADFHIHEALHNVIALNKISFRSQGAAQLHPNLFRTFFYQFHKWKNDNGEVTVKSCLIILNLKFQIVDLKYILDDFGDFLLQIIFNIHRGNLNHKYSEIKKPLRRVVLRKKN